MLNYNLNKYHGDPFYIVNYYIKWVTTVDNIFSKFFLVILGIIDPPPTHWVMIQGEYMGIRRAQHRSFNSLPSASCDTCETLLQTCSGCPLMCVLFVYCVQCENILMIHRQPVVWKGPDIYQYFGSTSHPSWLSLRVYWASTIYCMSKKYCPII